jgi:hypothetical protein
MRSAIRAVWRRLPRIGLETLTAATFADHLHESFRVHAGDGALSFALVEVSAPDDGGRPFSVVFRGPAAPLLAQRIYRIEHPATGPLELFIVPIGQDAEGVRYEAVFT